MKKIQIGRTTSDKYFVESDGYVHSESVTNDTDGIYENFEWGKERESGWMK